ncbi:hypothetical protein SODALDRAFT_322345 [Sodiomyces alkalinus F11]|uniref:Guanine nucleotide exchange factor Vps9 n=1 Tax=Sodiomyces alkalinus (strain CBS 110278 / VKM F-3762 / F11) TaxID=1314773 RepID=A0A3N2Q344_SODAK|nr:hypothetical protein SODALDRAFT_322345 [Sodiomyces alkalinus F11]ROT41147.1 hypothetical protein SODALDRAFT_322345 [Sodiomyces alkalinus F11]
MSAVSADKRPATGHLIDFSGETSPPVTYDTPAKDEQKPSDSTDHMTSSVATLKPSKPVSADTPRQYLTISTTGYVDPTPPTPTASGPPSRATSSAGSRNDASPTRSDVAFDDRRYASEDDQEGGSRSEIQSIMEQFTGDGGGPGADEVMSPRLEITSPILAPPIQHPPRKSSLEHLGSTSQTTTHSQEPLRLLSSLPSSPATARGPETTLDDEGPPVPPKDSLSRISSLPLPREDGRTTADGLMSPAVPIPRPPPPEPEPEPALPFDFHRFLEQLRNKKADPVARYLKSFLSEFGKRQWMVHEQVKIIGDFLAFIANKMAQCDVWRDVSDAEFDNAREGMEKLVMNRLYTQTFSPAIPAPQPIPGAKPKKRGGEPPLGPGRRGQHQEDVERDEILAQKVSIYSWIREEHLDIPATSESGKRFLKLAQQELLKIKSYRAPRDKIICALNCCKLMRDVTGLLRHNKSDSSADSFMPLLIYVVLQANPEHLVSNVQYILRFRNQDKLAGEAGYYLSSLMGAIQFIENMDRTSLTITDEEFEKHVEAAVSAIAEKHRSEEVEANQPQRQPHQQRRQQQQPLSEKTPSSYLPSTGSEPASSSNSRLSVEVTTGDSTPRRSTSSNDGESDDRAGITGLLRTIQRPLSTIGRMLTDEPAGGSSEGARTPQQPVERRDDAAAAAASRHVLSAEEAAARQASAETAEAHRLHRAEHNNVVETLAGMFPDLDREVISDVVYQKQGRVGLAVDACLALSS